MLCRPTRPPGGSSGRGRDRPASSGPDHVDPAASRTVTEFPTFPSVRIRGRVSRSNGGLIWEALLGCFLPVKILSPLPLKIIVNFLQIVELDPPSMSQYQSERPKPRSGGPK